ncbi:type II toxin-antitoxin system RelE/ParE family toxin [Anabaena cylindrica UHCC 0172]|uniref:type II toxin-antitoxin system RelE/ParE family toxin n=1 Tax=Anabaena cylindrica TaxID=1165 RepID=UPI002B1EE5D9|nr:type II toxin-antitoxin system RelE/ParE family toxin [Anabaena cylindrica]MEA5554532.1 type II toxin-antitoxin system RelE/ParE family toxin [Anabaena cylindrica UHCC 0172]
MKYRVRITPTALEDAEEFYLWISQDSPINGANWFNRLIATIDTLAFMPQRCPIAPEKEIVGQEIRYLLYSKRYRILFGIEGDAVIIYHIRHTSQEWMTREEFLRQPYKNIAPEK